MLANAVKFTERGEVVVTATVERLADGGGSGGRQRFHLTIRDTGIGIDPESMKKLFQCFRQGHESMTRKYGGTGDLPLRLSCNAQSSARKLLVKECAIVEARFLTVLYALPAVSCHSIGFTCMTADETQQTKVELRQWRPLLTPLTERQHVSCRLDLTVVRV
jgi:hypothetical protein